jgi:hypothetical protein
MDFLAMMQIVSGVLTALVLFILKDIKIDLNSCLKEILDHHSNSAIHCSKEKFKLHIS